MNRQTDKNKKAKMCVAAVSGSNKANSTSVPADQISVTIKR